MSNQPEPHGAADTAASAAPSAIRSALVSWEAYCEQNRHIFPSAESWRWFLRQHRDELVARGALYFLAGKSLVKPDALSAALEEIGQRLAKARAA